MEYLLRDELEISEEDLEIRKRLYDVFMDLPENFVSKMRHLQPQVGCFNNCSFCSKFSICKSEYWSLRSLRNIISALKYTSNNYTADDLLLAWDRKEHRIGVIFPYLNNDTAAYPYLYEYIDLCYKELGVRTRISTVGYSRHNKVLNDMHKKIASSDLFYALGGVRLSISQYGRVWEEPSKKNSLEDYSEDIANFLSIYKTYYDKFGSGSRKMCCEIRFNPLVENSKVLTFTHNNKYVIATSNYLYISKEKNIEFEESFIKDPYVHSLDLTTEGIKFLEYNLPFKVDSKDELIEYIENNNLKAEKEVEVYMFTNKDGVYYSIDPKLTPEGNYGINIYPETEIREKSGYIITERFFINALYNFKKSKGHNLKDKLTNTTYEDVEEVINILKEYSTYYKENSKLEKSNYILEHIIPVIEVYVKALKKANYSSDVFFDKKFTIDTGIICNLGRAINLFKGLTKFINEPLTPTHERNYGRHCSTMKQENYVWLLGCDFHDNILIEKLDLFNTASTEGQVSIRKRINIEGFNKKISEEEDYLYPGAKE